MGFIGILVGTEAIGIFWKSFFGFLVFIFFYIVTAIYIAFDCYYLGLGRSSIAVTGILFKYHWETICKLVSSLKDSRLNFSLMD